MYGDALFGGPDGCYRYLLWRCWDTDAHQLSFVLCNPSSAGGLVGGILKDDDTVNQLIDIALADGAGGFVLVNLLAHVEPKSRRLRLYGPETDDSNAIYLEAVVALPNKVVVGWGATRLLRSLSQPFLKRLADRHLWCLGTNEVSGTPKHPLPRGPKLTRLIPFEPVIH